MLKLISVLAFVFAIPAVADIAGLYQGTLHVMDGIEDTPIQLKIENTPNAACGTNSISGSILLVGGDGTALELFPFSKGSSNPETGAIFLTDDQTSGCSLDSRDLVLSFVGAISGNHIHGQVMTSLNANTEEVDVTRVP